MGHDLTIDNSEEAWDRLVERVDRFLSAWSAAAEPPVLAEFLPEGPPSLRRLVLVELVKVDLEQRARRKLSLSRIEDYAAAFPELADGQGAPCDLIFEEYQVRKQAGESVKPQEYFRRFPHQAESLRRLLDLDDPRSSTVLVSGEKGADIEVGSRLDDFDLLNELGHGAFARVFLARQRSLQRIVALKVSADRGIEAQTMAQLDHPHIVRVFDQRVLSERNLRLIYMQYVAGGTLHDALDALRLEVPASWSGKTFLAAVERALLTRGETPPAESPTRRRLARATWPEAVCWIGARLAAALDHAHERGVLHRDIKPANVLLGSDASPKLADFNISFSSKLDGATPAAYFGGSLAYMSPEQLEAIAPHHAREADSLDGRSDTYSLAVVLWELLTGGRPFDDGPIHGDWAAMLNEMIERRRGEVSSQSRARVPANCPDALVDVLLRCLAPERDDRCATAGELARQLEMCLQPRSQALLRPRRGGWRDTIRRAPITTLAIVGLVPNILASWLNIRYNLKDIVEPLPQAEQDAFYLGLFLINSPAYSLGLSACVWLAWPVVRAMRRANGPLTAAASAEARRRSATLGDWISVVVIVEWIIAGVMFPFVMQMAHGGESVIDFGHYLHFLASQTLCGLIATSLVFFGVTFITTRVFYPLLIDPAAHGPEETERLMGLSRRVWLQFGVAVSAPFLAVLMLVMIDTQFRAAVGIMGGFGLASFGLTLWLTRAIQGDLATLAVIVRPPGEGAGVEQETWDSFWTDSRRG